MARRRKSYAPSEAAITMAVLQYWLTLGLPNTLVAAIPNAFAHGQPGLTKGLPDLMVIGPRVPGQIAFMELKRDVASSKLSDAQSEFQRLCHRLGIEHAVAIGRDQPIAILQAWGVVKPARAAA
jgi:hypothetical protein